MKPITYWVQNDAVNRLAAEYGSHLQNLEANDRRLLIAYLALDTVAQRSQVFQQFLAEFEESAPISDQLDAAISLIDPLDRHQKDLLMEAIAATLTHQPQKTGTPSH
ncbi:MAG: hypothetical protein KME42_19755 [Tildeniella nuda ZEHNDER 1965/U140]|jgi:hypothetical protein|nr:hypothetical protein [Tildeniella nuda ZEHNDER 1965/U140]